MAQDSDTGEKTEEPTGKKLSEAVTKGNIAKSMDINTAAILAVALMLLALLGAGIWESLQSYLTYIFRDLGSLRISSNSVRGYMAEFLQIASINIIPLCWG